MPRLCYERGKIGLQVENIPSNRHWRYSAPMQQPEVERPHPDFFFFSRLQILRLENFKLQSDGERVETLKF